MGVATLALATACSSSGNSNPTPSTPKGMSWEVNGTAMSTTQTMYKVQASYLKSGQIEVIGTYNNATASNGVDLIMPKAVGTYAVTDTSQTSSRAAYVVVPLSGGGGSSGMFGNGTVTVTSLTSTEIIGTFNYSGRASGSGGTTVQQAITNGKFNVSL